MAALLTDEHFPRAVVDALRRLGHDVETVRQHSADKRGDGLSDEAVLRLAARFERILVTQNHRHFLRLHREQCVGGHAGIVSCRVLPRASAKRQAKWIDEALKAHPRWTGQFVRVPVEPEVPETPRPPKRRRKRGDR